MLNPRIWNTKLPVRVGALAAVAALTACGGGGGGATGEAGMLRVSLTDAPACHEHVFVTVEKVRVHQSGTAADADAGWSELMLSPAKRIDLLTLTNGVLEELGTMPLPAGKYSQVRLVLASNTAAAPLANAVQPPGGTLTPLRTPSSQQSGLKLQANVDVQSNQMVDLVLDFDACKSVVTAGGSGQYNLKPVVSVTPRFAAAIQGYVNTTMTLNNTVVSAQRNGAVMRSTIPDATGRFTLAFLQEGQYDVVIASEGRATAVVTGVPVATATGTTALNGTATAILSPVSSMAAVTGTTSVSPGTTLVTDATVAATQVLTGGPTVLVSETAVDALLATYTLRLPAAAPVKAPYALAGLVFTADTAAAGKYAMFATAPGRNPVPLVLDVTKATTANFSFAP